MTSPQRPPRPALAALLLIPLAALWVIFSSVRSTHHAPPADSRMTRSQEPAGSPSAAETPVTLGSPVIGSPAMVTPVTSPPNILPPTGVPRPMPPPSLPALTAPPRVLAGASTQSDFTLLAAIALSDQKLPTPPPFWRTSAATAAMGRNFLMASDTAGVGLWIHVRDGIGFKSLTVPEDGLRHVYPLGNVSYAVQTQLHANGYTPQWIGPGGMPFVGEMPPYRQWLYPSATSLPPTQAQKTHEQITLIPSSLLSVFRVNAQALTAQGKALGGPVTLLCQPYDADTLFIRIPAAYSAQTKQLQVTMTRTGAKSQAASWRITDLPPALKHGPDKLPFLSTARIGPYSVSAEAAESEDTSGVPDFINWPPGKFTGNGMPKPQNLDNHGWTDLPTLRYRIHVRPVSTTSANESWLLQLNQVTPQWTLPLPTYAVINPIAWQRPPNFLSLSDNSARQLSPQGPVQDAEIGIAYPGQQHWLKFDGLALRSSLHTETVTFHNADVVHEAAFGGDRVVWRQPEAQTTPSGITFLVLNGQPGGRGTGAYLPPVSPSGYSPLWWYDRGNAELLLAYRLPPGMKTGNEAKPNSPRVAEFPFGVTPLAASVDTLRPAPFALKVGVPGAVNARALQQAGYSFLRVSTWLSGPVKRTPKPFLLRPGGKPEVLPPYSWREGPEIVTAQPLPRHLKTLSLQITVREQQEQHPFHLIVPVRASPPPGWDPKPLGVPR